MNNCLFMQGPVFFLAGSACFPAMGRAMETILENIFYFRNNFLIWSGIFYSNKKTIAYG